MFAGVNCQTNPTIQTIIDKYSSRLPRASSPVAQPHTERKSLRPFAQNQSLTSTLKPKPTISRETSGSALRQLCMNDQQARLSRQLQRLSRELLISEEHLQLALDEKRKYEEKCRKLQEGFRSVEGVIGNLENKVVVCEENMVNAEKRAKEVEDVKREEVGVLIAKLDGFEKKIQLVTQELKGKDEHIDMLNKRVLAQQDDYLKLTKINSLLKEKLAKEVRFVEQQSKAILNIQQQRQCNDLQGECHKLHTTYNLKFIQMQKDMDRVLQQHKKSEQLSKAQITQLLSEKQSCQTQLQHIKQDLNKLQCLYQSILSQKQQQFRRCIEQAYRKLHNDDNQTLYQQKLKELMARLCNNSGASSKVSRMFDRELEKLRQSQTEKENRIRNLEIELNVIKSQLKNAMMDWDLLSEQIKELKNQKIFLANELSKQRNTSNQYGKENQQHLQGNRLLKEQLAQTQQQLIRITASHQQISSRLKQLDQRYKSLQESTTQSQSKYLQSTQTLQSLVLQLTQQKQSLSVQLQSQTKQLSCLHQTNTHLQHELTVLPTILEQQYRVKIQNEREEARQERRKKEEIIDQKEKIYCRLKGIEREYELFKSQMLSVDGVMKIATRVSKRYQIGK